MRLKKLLLRMSTALLVGFTLISTLPVVAQEDTGSTFIPTPALPSDLPQSEEEVEEVEQSGSEPETTESEVEETVDSEVETTSQEEEQSEDESGSLLDGPYLAYASMQFETQEDADMFIEMVEEDEEANNQFVSEQNETADGRIIVTLEYTQEATPEGRPILFYASADFPTEEEATQFMEQTLLTYPDIFFDGEVFEYSEGVYDVIFGIRVEAETQAIRYNPDSNTIEYGAERQPFTYEVPEGEEDPIQPAVEEAFPGGFTFERGENEDGYVSVTMTPSEEQSESANVSSQETTENTQASADTGSSFLDSLPFGNQQSMGILIALGIILIAGLALIIIRSRSDR